MISRKNGTVVDAQVSSRHSRLSLSDVEPLEATCRGSEMRLYSEKKERKARRRVSRLGWYSISVTAKAVFFIRKNRLPSLVSGAILIQ